MIGNHCLYNLPREVNPRALSSAVHGQEGFQASNPRLASAKGHELPHGLQQNLEDGSALQVLNARLRMEGPGGASYYSFSPHTAWRVVVLDGYDVSLLGWPPEHPLHQQAQRLLDESNPNQASHQNLGVIDI